MKVLVYKERNTKQNIIAKNDEKGRKICKLDNDVVSLLTCGTGLLNFSTRPQSLPSHGGELTRTHHGD